ncbi:MAG: bifunctional methylenetetrahydrofolate dehydrogenase/methenyltetrahydrofolate cyclohydrolase FolD [bacterium]|nr:bifunctional methylenetetrahydrofolate dehydrogenase/methenyltetrahydrofolate cyclohydrolase FolD [bacterium]
MAQILSGTLLSKTMRAEMTEEVASLKAQHHLTPGLAVVLVGDDPASLSYIKGKRKACADIGLFSVEHTLTAQQPESDLLDLIDRLNSDPAIHGILVQLPLPKGFREQNVLNAISPDKDVDGLHPINLGRLMRGEEGFLPCTPHGVQQILKRGGFEVAGKHVVVVGRSTLVGRPLANMLSQKADGANATVTLCHTGTRDLGRFTRQADILVVVTGYPNTITADMVKEGCVVIDVGVNRIDDATTKSGHRLIGDVDFDAVAKVASAITPVPGGVGPMTITMLLYNTIWSARRANGLGRADT